MCRLKKLKANPKNISWGIKDKNDNILTNKSEILDRWAEFYEQLYFDDSPNTEIDDSTEDPIPEILKSEIVHAINHLKTGKSPGLDNIYSEYFKAGGEPLVDALHLLFNKIRSTFEVPNSFKEALLVVLFKKGSRLDCGNYRPISLLSHVYKLFITIFSSIPSSLSAWTRND